jgi:hypothetical protein
MKRILIATVILGFAAALALGGSAAAEDAAEGTNPCNAEAAADAEAEEADAARTDAEDQAETPPAASDDDASAD